MKHRATESFWAAYKRLPLAIQRTADKNYSILREDPSHPSLRFKKVTHELWSARVGKGYRALAVSDSDGFTWIWIGPHHEYDTIISGR